MKALVFLYLACSLPSLVLAEEGKPTVLPPGPLLNKAPDFAKWTVISKVESAAEDEKAPEAEPSPSPKAGRRRLTSVEGKKAPPVEQTTVVTKTQSLRLEETNAGAGPKIQKWCVPDMQILMNGSAAPVVAMIENDPDSFYIDYSKTDFPKFDWITEQSFTGVTTVMEQECLTFEGKVPLNHNGSGDSSPSVPAVAFVNSATRLPVKLQLGDETMTYEFGLAPTAMLTLPPEVATVVEQWRKTIDQSALMPAKP